MSKRTNFVEITKMHTCPCQCGYFWPPPVGDLELVRLQRPPLHTIRLRKDWPVSFRKETN